MKAWRVSDGDNHMCVVFADTAGQAKNKAMGHLDACEYTEMVAKRFRELDGREATPPTNKELVLRHGWQLSCTACERMIGDWADKAVWSPKGVEVYCNKKCQAYMKKVREENKRANA